jgi:hypothetical protein
MFRANTRKDFFIAYQSDLAFGRWVNSNEGLREVLVVGRLHHPITGAIDINKEGPIDMAKTGNDVLSAVKNKLRSKKSELKQAREANDQKRAEAIRAELKGLKQERKQAREAGGG